MTYYVIVNQKSGEKVKTKNPFNTLVRLYNTKDNGAEWKVYLIRKKRNEKRSEMP